MNPISILRFDGALVTDIGPKRKQNQDSGLSLPDEGLFMVADGMGGHRGGEIASQLCVDAVREVVSAQGPGQESDPILLQSALQAANGAIFDRASRDPVLQGMGTTATILKIKDQIATLIQVGDSRAYFWNQSGIWQITRDHSYVQEKIRAGLITREQARHDEMKNIITRSVGYEGTVNGDIYQLEVEAGDGFLLCSDGLSGPIDDASMFEILMDGEKRGAPLSETAERLVRAANTRGGDDNVTVILVRAQVV